MTVYRTIVADPPWPYQAQPGPGGRIRGDSSFLPYATMSIADIKALPVKDLSNNVDHDAHLYLWTTDSFLEQAMAVARSWGFQRAATLVWCKPPMGEGLGGIWPANVEFVLFCRRPKVAPDVLELTVALADAAERARVTRADVDAHMGTTDMGGWWLSRLAHRCACPTNDQWPRLKALLRIGDELDDLVRDINARKGVSSLARTPGRWYRWPRGEHSAKPDAFLDLVEQVSPGPYLELFARRQRLGWDTWGNEALEHVTLAAEA